MNAAFEDEVGSTERLAADLRHCCKRTEELIRALNQRVDRETQHMAAMAPQFLPRYRCRGTTVFGSVQVRETTRASARGNRARIG